MVNFSDLSKMTEKHVSGFVKNVKSMVNPEHAAAESAKSPIQGIESGDALGQKIGEIKALMQALENGHAEHEKKMNVLNKALNSLYQEIENWKKPTIELAAPMSTTPISIEKVEKTEENKESSKK